MKRMLPQTRRESLPHGQGRAGLEGVRDNSGLFMLTRGPAGGRHPRDL